MHQRLLGCFGHNNSTPFEDCCVSKKKQKNLSLMPKVTRLTCVSLLLCYSLKEFLPHSYIRANKIEKQIFKEHNNLQGTSEVDAKVKYVKLARGLPTFGVHFFLVKVRHILKVRDCLSYSCGFRIQSKYTK